MVVSCVLVFGVSTNSIFLDFNRDEDTMNIMNYIAISGGILSAVNTGWLIYNNLQDKPKIKIKTSFGVITDDLQKTLLFITAINKGKRSIYLSGVGLRTNEEECIPPLGTSELPCELKPGTSHREFFEVSKLKDRQFNFAWYLDETGKIYKSKSIRKKLDIHFKRKPEKGKKIKRK